MKHLPVLAALLVVLATALAILTGRPTPPDASLFGAEMALEPVLPPLVLPLGALALAGRVTSSAGEPVADVLVTLARDEDEPSEAAPLHHAYSDADGRFALSELVAGRYEVALVHPSAPPRTFLFELPSAGEVLWELAAPLPALVSLPDITRAGLVGALLLPEALRSDAPGTLEGFEVVLAPAPGTPALSGASERRTTSDAQGRFALSDVVAAAYQVEVLPPWARGGSWPVLARSLVTLSAAAPSTLVLTLEVGALQGELLEEGTRPLSGALVRVTALEARDGVGEAQMWPPVASDAAGRFRVELLPPGRYRLHLRAGSDALDLEVGVLAGQRTLVAPGRLQPRRGQAPEGG